MALLVIPVDSVDPNYTIDVSLSGGLYRLRLWWNNRSGNWTLDVLDTSDNPIVAGVVLVADWELLSHYPNPALPPGMFYCVDTSGQSLDPGYDDLGARVILVYDDGT